MDIQFQQHATVAAPAALLLLTDEKLIAYFQAAGTPLPFGLTRLRQDRLRGVLGGIPYRRLAGKHLYVPDEVSRFLLDLPVIQAKPNKTAKRTGRPDAAELACAARRGLSVSELRAQTQISGLESNK